MLCWRGIDRDSGLHSNAPTKWEGNFGGDHKQSLKKIRCCEIKTDRDGLEKSISSDAPCYYY